MGFGLAPRISIGASRWGSGRGLPGEFARKSSMCGDRRNGFDLRCLPHFFELTGNEDTEACSST